MSEYRSVLAYLGERALARKVCTLAAQVAAAQGAVLDAAHLSGAAECELVGEIARSAGVQAQCHPIAEGLVALVDRTLTTDLLVVSQPGSVGVNGSSVHFASQLLIGASCPMLFVPTPQTLGTTCGSRILVAWAPRRESARALRDALPLLQRATKVELREYGAGQAPAKDSLVAACAYLQLHGVNATYAAERMGDIDFSQRMMTPTVIDASVAELLLSDAADMSADLIVMGGYGHSRAHEFLLGGVTRSMLASMTVPVLMSH